MGGFPVRSHKPAGVLTVVAICGVALLSSTSQAWWDTLIKTWRPVPLVKEYEAEKCRGIAPDSIKDDPQADGGRGGKAVLLTSGGPGITVDMDGLEAAGLYCLWAIARAADCNAELPRKPDFVTLRLTEAATGEAKSWTVPITHRERYFAVAQIYFPTYAGGNYTATVSLDARSQQPLLVDRFELRDVLGNCERKALKTKRMLISDEDLAAKRAAFAAGAQKQLPVGQESFRADQAARVWEDRLARNEKLWAWAPDFNAPTGHADPKYGWLIGRDRPGIVADAANAYELTGNDEFGWDGAVALCALAEKYPAIDYFVQATGRYTNLERDKDGNVPFHFSAPPGKSVYRGWAGGDYARILRAYDALFDFIKGKQRLAEYVGTKIPWIKTPQDVVRLLDTNLIQAGLDQCNRTYISGDDLPKALAPLVQGVGDVSNRMLEEGIFSAMDMNMTYAGGIDDQAICSYSRDGVHYIGSVGYLSADLLKIAEVLHLYRAAGGPARFDLTDPKLYPHMMESAKTIAQCNVAGGFPLVIGDARDLRTGRASNARDRYPSRILGGFGLAVLETGEAQDDPLRMRAAAVHTGIGRGHAHQDTLNLDLFAFGCRMAPDLGGRHEGPNRGSPNMRWNKVHNLVEVDNRNFENSYAGSTVSGTGWTLSLSPQPGAQFMSNAARATSHPQVSRYQRDTALIDVDGVNSYVFDVFRVDGGQLHTYCFHGARSKDLKTNADLKPAASESAKAYLAKHKEGTRVEGPAPATLVADWTLDEDLQRGYQGSGYQKDRRPVTRLNLFGVGGADVLAGNATSEFYQYDFPFLYVQRRTDQPSLSTAWTAVVEPFAGEPFIVDKQSLAVTGEPSAQAVVLKTTSGLSDLLYSSLQPEKTGEAGGARFAGRFGYCSTDAKGFRMAHLVGGTELAAGGVSIRAERAAYVGRIATVDYANRSLRLDQPLPSRLLGGAWAGIDNGAMVHNFRLESVTPAAGGCRVTHEKTARYYQSTVLNADAAAGAVECEIEPVVFGADTRYCDGTTVSNESGDKFWKASLEEGDRWMNLGFPGYRGSSPNKLMMAMFPDADGDGKRTLKLIGIAADKDKDGASLKDKVLLTLEVTRIAPDGETFYFKLPKEEAYQRGGWQFADRRLENEDKSVVWQAMYAGSSFRWKLKGEALTVRSLPDADGNGKAKLAAYVYGPGDTLRVDTFVYVARLEDGVYSVRANVPCTITLPGTGKTQISRDNGAPFEPLPASVKDGKTTIKLDEAALGKGVVQIKIGG